MSATRAGSPTCWREAQAATACSRPTRLERSRLARAAEGIRDVHADAGAVLFAADRDAVAALTLSLAAAGIGIHALVPAGGLEELFFDLTDSEPA